MPSSKLQKKPESTGLSTPRFSVVIPAYNREDTVGRSIESALTQTLLPMEILVVDDGSQDGTAAVIESFGGRVRLIPRTNGGAPAARNSGVFAAQGDWVAFLDSDDYWTPEHLSRMAGAIEATSGAADYYFSDIDMADNEGGRPQWERAEFEIAGSHELLVDGTPWVLRRRVPMMLQASVFHRERLAAEGGLWESLPMRDDTHVFLRHGIARPICAVAGIGTIQTSDDVSGGRLTTTINNRTLRYWRCSVLMWRELLGRIPKIDRPSQQLVRQRLATSHMRMGILSAKEGQMLSLPRHFFSAALVHPKTLLQTLGKKMGLGPKEDFTA